MNLKEDLIRIDGVVTIKQGKLYIGEEYYPQLQGINAVDYDLCYGYIQGDEVNVNFVISNRSIDVLIENFQITDIHRGKLKELVAYSSSIYNSCAVIPRWFKNNPQIFFNFISYVRENHWKRLLSINGFPSDACDVSGYSPSVLLEIMVSNPLSLYSIFPSLALKKDLLTINGGTLVIEEDIRKLQLISDGVDNDGTMSELSLNIYGWNVVKNKIYSNSVLSKSFEVRNFLSSLRGINITPNLDGLNQTQIKAITSRSNKLFITGGPGTGKSFIIKRYIETFQQMGIGYYVVALSAVAVDNLDDDESFQGSTIHMTKYRNTALSKAKVIIIEEVSMINLTHLWWIAMRAKLCKKIIFVGDKDQIPPFGGLSVTPSLLKGCSVIRLDECMRREEPIIKFDEMTFSSLFDNPNIIIVPYSFDIVVPLLVGYYQNNPNNLILATNNDLVDLINNGINGSINGGCYYISPGSKVSCRRNNYSYNILNGQDFIVEGFDGVEVKLIPIARSRSVNILSVPRDVFFHHFSLGYVRTIHRSQGKESENVVVILPYIDGLLTKNLLYTAITRSKSKVIICTNIHRDYDLPEVVLPECPIFI